MVIAQDERSIAVGGNAIGSLLITGDYNVNKVFAGTYACLRDAYIQPRTVIESAHLDRFVGREWLIKEIDTFLRKQDRGYFVLEAPAGLGKTTLLAWLAKKRGYIHHFVDTNPGLEGVGPGLKSLAAQLVTAFEIDPYSIEGVLPGAAVRPDFLQNLLFEAARHRDKARPGSKIILLVDSLDKAGTPLGQNPLGLPNILPKGVYFIVSQRLGSRSLWVEPLWRQVFLLRPEDPDNLSDMRNYLEKACSRPGIRSALDKWSCTEDSFVGALLAKCRGMWLYLHYVVEEIEQGNRPPLHLENLPEGLWQYYAQYWDDWRRQSEEVWYARNLPLLATLAAVQEPLPISLLRTLADVDLDPTFHRLLDEDWRPFLAIDGEGVHRRYHLYHASLQDFLAGCIPGQENLTESERFFAQEMAHAVRHAHMRVANHYLNCWGGLENGLPGLLELKWQILENRYGLRHVITHLEKAQAISCLQDLLRAERKYEEQVKCHRSGWQGLIDRLLGRKRFRVHADFENAWYAAHDSMGNISGYLSDLDQAWRLAEQDSKRKIQQCKPATSIGTEVRCALIKSSLNSLAGKIPPQLLRALIREKVWQVAEGLVYARSVPSLEQRAQALIGLVAYLPKSEHLQAFQEALQTARKLDDESVRARALVSLAPHVPETFRLKIVKAIREIRDDRTRLEALTGLVPHLPEKEQTEAIQEALKTAWGVAWKGTPAERVLSLDLGEFGQVTRPLLATSTVLEEEEEKQGTDGLAPQATETKYSKRIQEALEATRAVEVKEALEILADIQEIPDEQDRARALGKLAQNLPQEVSREVLAAARAIRQQEARVEALTGLASRLAAVERAEVLQEAREVAQAISDKETLAEALLEVAIHLPKEELDVVIGQALVEARQIQNKEARARTLAKLAPHFPQIERIKILEEVRSAVRMNVDRSSLGTITKSWTEWVKALACFALYLTEGLLREALLVAQIIPSEQDRAQVLAELALHIPNDLISELLVVAQVIREDESRARILASLASRLPAEARPEILRDTLSKAQKVALEKARPGPLMVLIPLLPDSFLEETLGVARAIALPEARAKVMAALVPHLRGEHHNQVLKEILTVARDIQSDYHRAQLLAEVAPSLSENLLQEALVMVQAFQDEDRRAEALAGLAPYLQEKSLLQALELVRSIRDEDNRTQTLAGIISYLPREYTWEVITLAQKIKDTKLRGRVLELLTLRLVELDYPEVALTILQTIQDPRERANVLVQLAPRLAERNHFKEALDAVRNISDEDGRAQALVGLPPHLPEWVLRRALTLARAIKWQMTRAWVLAHFSSRLCDSARTKTSKEAIAAVGAIQEEDDRIWALAMLISHLPNFTSMESLIDSMLTTWLEQRQQWVSTTAHPPADLLQKMLKAVLIMEDKQKQARALAELIPHLPEKERIEAIHEVLNNLETIVWEETQSEVLAQLAPHIPDDLLQKALLATRVVRSEKMRAQTLTRLAQCLSGALLEEGKKLAEAIRDKEARIEALTGLAAYLPEKERVTVLENALKLEFR